MTIFITTVDVEELELEKEFNWKFPVYSAMIQIEYEYSPEEKPSMYSPGYSAEVQIIYINALSIETEADKKLSLTEAQALSLENKLDWDEMETLCFENEESNLFERHLL